MRVFIDYCFPQRWQKNKPLRVWGVYDLISGRLRSFKERAGAERLVARRRARGCACLLLGLWHDGCLRGGRRGYLCAWLPVDYGRENKGL